MAKLSIASATHEAELSPLTNSMAKRAETVPPGICPLTLQLSLLKTSALQTCGKCVPCSDGLPQLVSLLEQVVNCTASEETLASLKRTAQMIYDTSDCVIGYEAAERVLEGIELYAEEYNNHLTEHRCGLDIGHILPCESACPAHVDIPAYIAYAGEGDYEAALKVLRQDNPFPTACAFVCENPCEGYCRRALIDSPLNIRGIKRFIVEQVPADSVPVPEALPATGRRIAVIGGGPSGLTCAYYLALMGHEITLFERRDQLGGMLRFGIPAYRLPRERLDEDIKAILSAGDITVKLNAEIAPDKMNELLETYDAVYVSFGAQSGTPLAIEGADSEGVISAVELLEQFGAGGDDLPDFSGKKVIVVGGGNVAMDCARTALRAGSDEVSLVYRRRKEDMTALADEVESAIAEGVEMITLEAPVSIEVNEAGHCTALITQPQMVGEIKGGRPAPHKADKPMRTHEADIIIVAIGQAVESEGFGFACTRGRIDADEYLEVEGFDTLLAGGDCNTGPATAIRAIAAGKVAARNIDEALGYHHSLDYSGGSPKPLPNKRTPMGRVEISERPARERKRDYAAVELPMSLEEAQQECSRCLRCDYYGSAVLEGGRIHHA